MIFAIRLGMGIITLLWLTFLGLLISFIFGNVIAISLGVFLAIFVVSSIAMVIIEDKKEEKHFSKAL